MGLREMRRVTRGRIIIMTCASDELARFWLNNYAPEVIAIEAERYPPIATITGALGGHSDVVSVRIPLDCTDGFNEAYYGRPEQFLDEAARRAFSAWSFVNPTVVDRFLCRLRRDLADGTWEAAHGHLREQPEFEGSLKLIVATPDGGKR
jgi:hypothetical protein